MSRWPRGMRWSSSAPVMTVSRPPRSGARRSARSRTRSSPASAPAWRGPTVTREREFDSAGAVPSSRWPADSLQRLAEGSAVSLTVTTAEEMRELGRRLAAAATAGDLVILSGGLGAGKTTLTKGIGDGLGVRGPITSPTFVIARVHPPVGPAAGTGLGGYAPALVHADAYRLGSVL